MAVQSYKPIICPVVVGRELYLSAIESAIDALAAARGQIMLISGEAGFGKSRLVREAVQLALEKELLVLQGNCFETSRNFPYAPLVDLLSQHRNGLLSEEIKQKLGSAAVAALAMILPQFMLSSGAEPDDIQFPAGDASQQKYRLFQALVDLLYLLTAAKPFMLVLEDLHWMDDATLEFLHFLVRRCQDPKGPTILLVLTYRSDEIQPALLHLLAEIDRQRSADELRLSPLDIADVDLMIRAIFGLERPIRVPLLQSLYSLTEGNPFFVEETLKALITSGDIVSTPEGWERKPFGRLRTPRSIQDTIDRRVDKLTHEAKDLLALAAVIGQRFEFTLLEDTSGLGEQKLVALLKELIAAQLIVEEGSDGFAFRHAITQHVIYTSLLSRERRALHHRIAGILQQRPDYDNQLIVDLAHHYYLAEDWSEAFDYSLRAAQKAQALHAVSAVVEHYTKAFEAAGHMQIAVSAQNYRARGRALEILGNFDSALLDYKAALATAQAAGGQVDEWQSLLDIGMLWTSRDYSRAGEYFRIAIDNARRMGDPAALAHSLNRLGNWLLNREKSAEAQSYHQEALAIFQRLGDEAGTAETLDLLGVAYFLGGDLANGTLCYRQAAEIFAQTGNRQGLVSSLATLTLRGVTYQTDTMELADMAGTELAACVLDGESALQLARSINWRAGEVYALSMLVFCLGPGGLYKRAIDAGLEAVSIALEIGHSQWETAANTALGAIYLDLLNLDKACTYLEQALARAQSIGSLHWTRASGGLLASAYVRQNKLDKASEVLRIDALAVDPAQDTALTLGQRLATCARAELALAMSKPQEALKLTHTLGKSQGKEAIAGKASPSVPRGLLIEGEAFLSLHRTGEAEAALQKVVEIANRQGAIAHAYKAYLLLGHLHHSAQLHAQSAQEYGRVLAIVESISTGLDDAVVSTNFVQSIKRSIPKRYLDRLKDRSERATQHGGLTSRERDVARLIAKGESNMGIAKILVIGERTVETHVTNILSKLGFQSRSQIAAWVVEAQLSTQEAP